MRAACRVTLDTPSPSLASERERITAENRWRKMSVYLNANRFISPSGQDRPLKFEVGILLYTLFCVCIGFLLFFFTDHTHSFQLQSHFHIVRIAQAVVITVFTALEIRFRGKQTSMFLMKVSVEFFTKNWPFK